MQVRLPLVADTRASSSHRSSGRRKVAALAAAALVALLSAACVPTAPSTTVPQPQPSDRSRYEVLGGIEQLYVMGALDGDRITVEAGDTTVGDGVADAFGSLAVRGLQQGSTYSVFNHDSGDRRDVRILRESDHPDQSFYDGIELHEGLNYIPMRDGITLAATVRPPLGNTLNDGPFPTVIEYSGYQVAAPSEPVVAKLGGLLGLPKDPSAPGAETDVGGLLVRLAGYATVSVQLRGTGCSGGEADLFDLPSRYDGYDAVEAVAAQPWVSGNRVGMVGISFSGFSQIATAATQPPSLAAIAPMSFVGSLYDIAHPGGIFNDGFADTWMKERVETARPAPQEGALPYAIARVATDATCRDNQRLRLQTRNGDALIRSESLHGNEYERRDFRQWMGEIAVPTFASLQFEDEETSSYAMLSVDRLLASNDRVRVNLGNGHHRDSATPDTITEYFEFLDLYVAQRAPEPKLLIFILKDIIFGDGSVSPEWPATFGMSYEQALAQFESRPRVNVLLDLERGSGEVTNSGARTKVRAADFPVPGSVEREYLLGSGGVLADASDATESTVSYRPDPSARRIDPGPALVDQPVPFRWLPTAADAAVGFVTEPLAEPVVALGPAAASIALRSTAADTDISVTVSEVLPDGNEKLVGSGVQRASKRTVDPSRSTATRPAFTLDRVTPLSGADVVDMVDVQIMPIGHVFRTGSRIRVSISAVNGERERWAFDSVDPADHSTLNTIQLGGAAPSSVTLTLAPVAATSAPMPCPTTAKPCRPYAAASNGG